MLEHLINRYCHALRQILRWMTVKPVLYSSFSYIIRKKAYNALLLAKRCINNSFQNVLLRSCWFKVFHQGTGFHDIICTQMNVTVIQFKPSIWRNVKHQYSAHCRYAKNIKRIWPVNVKWIRTIRTRDRENSSNSTVLSANHFTCTMHCKIYLSMPRNLLMTWMSNF